MPLNSSEITLLTKTTSPLSLLSVNNVMLTLEVQNILIKVEKVEL